MNSQQIEQQRVAAYQLGWNDAAAGRMPREATIGYLLGYSDARRNARSTRRAS